MITDSRLQRAKATDILSLVPTQLHKVSTANGGEWAGPCPFCQAGTDRFRVWPATGRYWCRNTNGGKGCGKSGDVIDLVMELHNLTFAEAVDKLAGGVIETDKQQPVKTMGPKPKPTSWERRAREFTTYAMDNLDPTGIEYLEGRGIDKMTGYGAGLGWNPKAIQDNGERWGIDGTVYLGEGLVIPYEHAGKITAINIRTPEGYRIVKGSTLSIHGERIIYKPVPWPVKKKIILFEGEFDALAAWQALGGTYIGTGSIPAGNLKSLDQLGDRPCFVCFDTDEAGINATLSAAGMGAQMITLPKQFKDFNAFQAAVGDNAAAAFLLEATIQ